MAGPQGRLLSWLHSLKHFFLMDQGDMLVHLLEQPELHGTPSGLPAHRLQSLLDSALRSSSVAASPHVDVVGEGVLGAVMDKRSILQLVMAATHNMETAAGQADGPLFDRDKKSSFSSCLEMLLLTVKLSWPLTLVVSKRQLLHYQVIFKHLLSLKWAERDLGQLWQVIRSTKRLDKEDQARFRSWHLLCSQLLYVVSEVLRFTTIDVLEPLWGDMEGQLGRAVNMDEVISLHGAFLSAALERALLTESKVVRHVSVLLSAAHELAKEADALAADSDTGTGSNAGQQQQKDPQAVDQKKMMSMFCRDDNRQDGLMRLQNKVDQVLMELVRDLDMHYQHLLTVTTPAAGAGAGATGVVGLTGQVAGFSVGGSGVKSLLGDSSRDLASLHNLIQRLQWGQRMNSSSRQQLQRGLPTAY
eukprot:GHUV01018620.1.p1 GENE.GHUV01018620.1~~GHUV01018620.1.p1  ORF type:complete len:416 (+),score=150.65 GHUV01018620.1:1476-2723(+)